MMKLKIMGMVACVGLLVMNALSQLERLVLLWDWMRL